MLDSLKEICLTYIKKPALRKKLDLGKHGFYSVYSLKFLDNQILTTFAHVNHFYLKKSVQTHKVTLLIQL